MQDLGRKIAAPEVQVPVQGQGEEDGHGLQVGQEVPEMPWCNGSWWFDLRDIRLFFLLVIGCYERNGAIRLGDAIAIV